MCVFYPEQILELFVLVQLLSYVQLYVTQWTLAHQSSLSFNNYQSLLKFMYIGLVMLSNHLILCYSLIILSSIFPSIRVFLNESALHLRWPKYWSFSFISLSKKYLGLISLRIDWLNVLEVQGTLKSIHQHHSSKASILWHSAFYIVHLTSIHDYWKNYSLDEMDLCW